MSIYNRESTEIVIPQNVMNSLDALVQERKSQLQDNSISLDIILHLSGGGALVMKDAWGHYRAAVDFDEESDWITIIEALRTCENLLED